MFVKPVIHICNSIYPLAVIAAVELATRAEVASSLIGVVLAALGGGLSQMKRADTSELTFGQAAAEWGLSGMFGFLIAGMALQTDSPNQWLIWTSCVAAGLAGSEGLARWNRTKKNE